MKKKSFIVIISLCFICFNLCEQVFAKKGILVLADKALYKDTKRLVNNDKAVVTGCLKYEYIIDQILMSTAYLNFKWPEKNQHVELRTHPKMVNEKDYVKIIYQYNFYDSSVNVRGCFRNKFHEGVRFYADLKDHKNYTSLDQVTNLMWDEYNSDELTFHEAKETLEAWNKKSYGGYSDWRMPTLDETASLYTRFGHTFRGRRTRFWIADEFHDSDLYWVGDLQTNMSYLEPVIEKKGNEIKILKHNLMMVRNQPPPYPIIPDIIEPEEDLCRNWEQYHAIPELITQSKIPEWPDTIHAIKLRSKPVHYIDKNMMEYDLKNNKSWKNKKSLEYDLKETGFGILLGGFKCFQNYYVDVSDDVVVDLATNLMWQKSSSRSIEQYKKLIVKDDYIAQLNKDKFSGFSDWRVPTTPEVASLIERSNYGKNKSHLRTLFNGKYSAFHVSDTFSYSDNMDNIKVISVNGGQSSGVSLNRHRGKLKENIKAVRTLSADEVQKYCKQKGVVCQ